MHRVYGEVAEALRRSHPATSACPGVVDRSRSRADADRHRIPSRRTPVSPCIRF